MKEYIRKKWLDVVINVVGVCFILLAVITSIRMNLLEATMYYDEACLAASLLKRDLGNLFSQILEREQSAPVIYLLIVKIITNIMGSGEFMLRLYSMISFFINIFLIYLLSKFVFSVHYPILPAAFFSNIAFMLRYSSLLKPYMSEGHAVLMVLLAYWLYCEHYKKSARGFGVMTGIFCLSMLAANPATFMIASCMTFEGIHSLRKKQWMELRQIVLSGVVVFVVFIAYYFYWLKPVANSPYMQQFWDKFFLIVGEGGVERFNYVYRDVVSQFFRPVWLASVLLIVSLLLAVFKEKNKYVQIPFLAMFIAMVASVFRRFPIRDRMWVFAFPLFTILCFWGIDRVCKMITFKKMSGLVKVIAPICMFALIVKSNGISYYSDLDRVYWSGFEINPILDILVEKVEDGDYVFVPFYPNPAVEYYLDYEGRRIGDVKYDNVIMSTGWEYDEWAVAEDETNILQARKVFIIVCFEDDIVNNAPLFKQLREDGNLTQIYSKYDTGLYYFEKNELGVD